MKIEKLLTLGLVVALCLGIGSLSFAAGGGSIVTADPLFKFLSM